MFKMGFCACWIVLIMLCVKTVSYSVLVNGEPQGMIQPSRGIRQGHPLSPFLFLLGTEGLHGLIQRATRNGDFRGFSLCKRGPKLTHLFFADNNLLFCRANKTEYEKVLQVLAKYETSSGQKLNIDKTILVFSKSTLEENKDMIKSLWGYMRSNSMRNIWVYPLLLSKG